MDWHGCGIFVSVEGSLTPAALWIWCSIAQTARMAIGAEADLGNGGHRTNWKIPVLPERPLWPD
jgi:hypothetical protein